MLHIYPTEKIQYIRHYFVSPGNYMINLLNISENVSFITCYLRQLGGWIPVLTYMHGYLD